MLSNGLFGFGLKYTKLGISSLPKSVSFIVSVSVPHSGTFSNFYSVTYSSYGVKKNEMSSQQKQSQ